MTAMKQILALPALSVMLSCAHEQISTGKAATPVNTAAVELFAPGGGDRYSASLEPSRMVNVAFRVNGTVESVGQGKGPGGQPRDLQPGDEVSKDSELARVRQKDYQFQVDQANSQIAEARSSKDAAQSQLAQAEALSAKAGKDLDRARFLLENTSLTRPDFEAAQAQYDSSRAQVEAARAQMQAIAARIASAEAAAGAATLTRDDTVLRAPVAGVITQRNIETGGIAGPSVAAFSIADLSFVKALFGVPDSIVANVKTGTALALDIEAFPGRRFEGVISNIAPIADASTRLFQVEVTVPNPRRMLRPGMIAALTLAGGATRQPIPVVPLASIVRSPQSASAFAVMVVQGNAAHRRTVTLGETYGDRIGIASGLKAGEVVVSRGAGDIEDGESVVVIP